MYKFPSNLEERVEGDSTGGHDVIMNRCSVCHSNRINFVCKAPSSEDTFFLFNKLFEVPAEHYVKLIGQPSSAVQQLSAGQQLQFCSSCELEIETAKSIYQQLVVAVGQFRDIQKKLMEAVEARRRPRNVIVNQGPELGQRDFRLFDDIFFKNIEKNDPFIVENIEIKLERIIGASELDELPEIEIKDDISGEKNFESDDKVLEATDTEPNNTSSDFNSHIVVKEENDSEVESMCTDNEGRMSIAAEDDSGSVKTEAFSECAEESAQSKQPILTRKQRIDFAGKRNKKPVKKIKNSEESSEKPGITTSRRGKQPTFKCELCEKVFCRKATLKRHERKMHAEITAQPKEAPAGNSKSKIESYKCDVCSKVLKSYAALSIHKKRGHGIDPPRWTPPVRVCPEEGCTMEFKTKDSSILLRDHLSRCHGWDPSHKCSKCDKAFITRKQRLRHEQKVHEDGITTKPFICDLCGKRFSCLDYLLGHRSSQHTQQRRRNGRKRNSPFHCTLCDESYSDAASFYQHKSKCQGQGGEKSFICEMCGKALSSSNSLQTHIALVHEPEKLKESCHLCEKKFFTRRPLENHLYHHHHVGPKEYSRNPKNLEVFQCPISGCRKTFYGEKSKLDYHIIAIHGEDGKKPGAHKCRFCERTFHIKTKMQFHEMTHENANRRPHICDICEKGFATPNYLYFHKKNTHKITGLKVDGSKQTEVVHQN